MSNINDKLFDIKENLESFKFNTNTVLTYIKGLIKHPEEGFDALDDLFSDWNILVDGISIIDDNIEELRNFIIDRYVQALNENGINARNEGYVNIRIRYIQSDGTIYPIVLNAADMSGSVRDLIDEIESGAVCYPDEINTDELKEFLIKISDILEKTYEHQTW